MSISGRSAHGNPSTEVPYRAWVRESERTEITRATRPAHVGVNYDVFLHPGHFTVEIATNANCTYDFYFVFPDGTPKYVLGDTKDFKNGGSFNVAEGDFHDSYQGPIWTNKRFTFDPAAIIADAISAPDEVFPTKFVVHFYPEIEETFEPYRENLRGPGGDGSRSLKSKGIGSPSKAVVLTGKKDTEVGRTDRTMRVDHSKRYTMTFQLKQA